MSAQRSSTGDGNSGLNLSGDGTQQPVQGGGETLLLATADLADLLANGQWGDKGHGLSLDSADAYDGHVALALDTGVLPDIDSTLDLLTSSHHLFDVPALDVSSGSDDSSST